MNLNEWIGKRQIAPSHDWRLGPARAEDEQTSLSYGGETAGATVEEDASDDRPEGLRYV